MMRRDGDAAQGQMSHRAVEISRGRCDEYQFAHQEQGAGIRG